MRIRTLLLSVCLGVLLCLPCINSYAGVPRIIQGGMGIRISSWQLAREVSLEGELGVISGTVMDTILVRTLQDGDPTGDFRRALASFPDQDMVARAIDKYFVDGGKGKDEPYKSLPMWTFKPSQSLLEACVLANYCEVWLAKHNDNGSPIDGIVGINLLTKVQLPTVASLYGAMLAGVDYVIMGAGIPMQVPRVLDNLSEGKDVDYVIDVESSSEEQKILPFSPAKFWIKAGKPELAAPIKRPNFVPIVSSVVLAQSMLKRASGKGPTKGIQGFVVELPTAGGHNAPPRGFKYDAVSKSHAVDLNERGEPVYGSKDEVDIKKFSKASKGLPFWFAGSYADPDKLHEIQEIGGAGVQVGTMFALSKESGMDNKIKQDILSHMAEEDLDVFTDPVASPTGFPFKVLEIEGTLAAKDAYESRPRVCNLGYLRTPFIRPDGKIGYKCPSEPVDEWVKKGGKVEATEGRKCLCNSLCANAGFPQVRSTKKDGKTEKYVEEMLITIGDDVNKCRPFIKKEEDGTYGFSARDVVDFLRTKMDVPVEDSTDMMRNETSVLA